MKFCPTCQTHYDEDILRFCTKDGTPLLDENPPNFIDKPTASLDKEKNDIEEPTVIRRKTTIPAEVSSNEESETGRQRVVVPATKPQSNQQIRTKQTQPKKYSVPPPKKTNTTRIVFLTIVLTLTALLAVGGAYYFLTRESIGANKNTNLNTNIENENLDTNMNIDNSLFDPNFNVDTNINSNSDETVNISTPTPTPTRTPSPTPTSTPTPDGNTNTNVNNNSNINTNANVRSNANFNVNSGANTSRTPTPRPTPSTNVKPSPTPSVPSSPVNVGNVNGRAVNLPTPVYPSAARSVQAKGRVTIQVTIDQHGNVTSATPISGHPLLRSSAADAASRSRFNPVRISGQSVTAVGTIVYNFVNN